MIRTKIATIGLSLALVLGASNASAVTVAELQAQINALMAQLASLQGGSTTTGTYNFTQNLTVGSTGSEVVSLQTMLVAQGHLVMPAGVSMGYFGTLTQAAVAKWQAANGISPAAGYFGPISRAKANTMSGGTTTGGTTTGGTTTGGITTPGVEGTLTATLYSTPTAVKLYEGDSKKKVMGIELEAKLSDIKVERIKFKLDCSTCSPDGDQNFYRKIADMIYVMDGSTVLASSDLDSSTVVEESNGNYYVTVTGLNVVVPKDSKKVLTVALDAMSTWDSTYNGDAWTLTVPALGVRAVDGAGINLYSPETGTTLARNFTSENELIGSASLQVSIHVDSPKTSEIIASEGVDNDSKDEVELLKFNLKAEDDDLTVTDLSVTVTHTGNATTTTFYLMDGSTVIGSENGNVGTGNEVTFDNIDFVVPADSTKVLTVKADITDADTTASTFSLAISEADDLLVENSAGDAIVETGSATGETLTALSVGPEITLVSKTLTRDAGTIGLANGTSTASATFNVSIKAVGGDLWFGTQSASSTFGFGIHAGGANAATVLTASTTGYTVPSGVVTSGLATNQAFKLAEGQTITIPVTFFFEGRLAAGTLIPTNSYAVGLSSVVWSDSQLGAQSSSTFMANKPEWRTSAVTMP